MLAATMAIYVASSGLHGRGVFTDEPLAKGDLIEVCPVMVIPPDQRPLIDQSVFSGYYFEWDEGAGGLAMGFGSYYNHSYKPNARYDPGEEEATMLFTAIKPIQPGAEITINYNGDPRSRKKLWFEAVE